MKKTFLIAVTFFLVFTLSGCFGNHLEGYTQYSRSVGDYDLYYENLGEDDECPQLDGFLYTLYSVDGNTFKYQGIRSSNGCYVPLLANTGTGFSTINNLLDRERITLTELENVLWTFDLTIIQTPDYEVGSIDFIEYFEQVGDYDIYVADYDDMICTDLDTVTLFEYAGVEYDVLGYESGDGCISNYYIYYIEETEDDTTDDDTTSDGTDDSASDDSSSDDTDTDDNGVIISIYDALNLGYLSPGDVVNAEYESDIIEIYNSNPILAISGSIYYVDEMQTFNQSNPYELSSDELDEVLEVLSASRFRYSVSEVDEETPFITLVDIEESEYIYLMYRQIEESTQNVLAVLTFIDITETEYIYEIYTNGVRIVSDDVFAENVNQTYILDLLEELE